jgi:hypothetical protein
VINATYRSKVITDNSCAPFYQFKVIYHRLSINSDLNPPDVTNRMDTSRQTLPRTSSDFYLLAAKGFLLPSQYIMLTVGELRLSGVS